MSIDLNWETLTTGPDGIALAEKIRDFVHAKFQTVTLPRFIKGVKVHTFDFGSIAPEVELKDICDPLPDFYEDLDDDDGGSDEDDEGSNSCQTDEENEAAKTLRERRKMDRVERTANGSSNVSNPPSYTDTRYPGLRSMQASGDNGSPFLGVSTPGIPGGTSNLSYFHSQLASGFSGTQTPLAAVAGAHLPQGWPDRPSPSLHMSALRNQSHTSLSHTASERPMTPPQIADLSQQSIREKASASTLAVSSSTTGPVTRGGATEKTIPEEQTSEGEEPTSPPRRFREPKPEDLQTVFRVRYSGNIRLSLTVDILLDYPMPSFVGIPVRLNITGLSFDGVAVLAYIRKRAHFCFLSPEDAYAAIGADEKEAGGSGGMKMGALLHEIKVESEIGQRENGKQVLKNVGKVEKFVLEQVRRIFEDEFVYPSFWTFLV
ncbi:hypothetical protein SS1G_06139 [Sclerotinia sclerotiorum 1980 UF-70]|uniref:Mitochondrial distribution and morphology protein 12 n=2 Tax=Sclerotinia sclerotiorum (strain ATCC 18683 / 1980 / Ss-1) TaxID=665079 RepID=MDM12_SCLS1|nr:hypothetical protein SS1G_06139 [Sclerotinia sclerotiorum 1980 UF-70]A7ELE2.1 RecName: Full=Mitochondrial distribution and morphology protein 12; AltName: Full=Mitochondrial inheritance component mdm12 [Sclerotinia sclerotiorum 1980 UF-70]APA09689.1 hypothetical protein sscle_05g044590 [Sclerotinia sclerotiorum 1980 UF-70]EDO03658.1 hypothetical protein SS1G_06139 [Sclerotinia sclerotiorum 1980 UF-70]